eukprot:TRINITY_DN25898_c0_g1_i1.p1 TRINITY_DN25898_c0_g1~~TRINITY_DN25898_c0_g1_i1.p1  ORF type:complete len:166 (+),score=44.54 TRINITY_DN25898_c0_g1_i1:56-553(+)
MGLSYEEQLDHRRKYPDRLQTQSRIADIDENKQIAVKAYAIGCVWGLVGAFPLTQQIIIGGLKKGAHFDASKSLFSPSLRRATTRNLANLWCGLMVVVCSHLYHTNLERETAAIWSIQATHVGDYKPKSPKFVDKFFPVDDQVQYSTVDQRAKALKQWSNDNATT